MKEPPQFIDAEFSVVIPFYNEEPNVRYVLEELKAALPNAEIVAVDDGSTDGTWAEISAIQGVRGLRLAKNQGQSAAMWRGLQMCTRDLCGVMDGDGQNDPANFLVLLEAYYAGTADVVCGYRLKRRDSLSRKVASRMANWIRNLFLKDGLRDTGCSQKVFRREAVDVLIPFRTMHRYLAAVFQSANLTIAEVPVKHRMRRAGASKYDNLGRALAGMYDLVGVSWLLNRRLLPEEMRRR